MKKLGKDELYKQVKSLLKKKGMVLGRGPLKKGLRSSCLVMTEAINFTRGSYEKVKVHMDDAMETIRENIHQSTAPQKKKSQATKSPKTHATKSKSTAASKSKKTVKTQPSVKRKSVRKTSKSTPAKKAVPRKKRTVKAKTRSAGARKTVKKAARSRR